MFFRFTTAQYTEYPLTVLIDIINEKRLCIMYHMYNVPDLDFGLYLLGRANFC